MSSAKIIQKELITALVTPMSQDEAIDFDSLTNLIEFQIKNKVNSFVILGSTAEAALLSHFERIEVVKHVIKITNKRAQITVGINESSTKFAVEFVKKLDEIAGIDYYMITAPSYVRPTQDGMYKHFKTIANSSDRLMCIYNVPSRTASDIANTTAIKLAHDCPNIIGFKDATGNIARAGELFYLKKKDFTVHSGDDNTALSFVLSGGSGVVSVISNVLPKEFGDVINNAILGNKEAAIAANDKIQDLLIALTLEPNPIPIKWSLYYMGIISYPSVRLPLTIASTQVQDRLKAALINFK